MIVDFHTHVFPDRIAAAAVHKLKDASHTQSFTDGTLSGLRASMAQAGIDYSVVLPLTSITYIWTMLVSFLFLKEHISVKQIIGVSMIVVGAVLITR